MSGWKPKGSRKIAIHWGTGLGGFKGTVKKMSSAKLKGRLKQWCDYRCGGGGFTGELTIQPTNCSPD
jgi:hypothetical protein